MLDDAERDLVERLARRVVDLRMTAPAILFLEGSRPLSFLASQALLFFRPVLETVWATPDLAQLQDLLERRNGVDALVSAIEDEAERLVADRTAARRRRREENQGGKE